MRFVHRSLTGTFPALSFTREEVWLLIDNPFHLRSYAEQQSCHRIIIFSADTVSWSIQHHLALGLFPHKTYGYMPYVTVACDKNNFSGCCLDLPSIVEMINLLSGATNLTHEDGKLIFQVIMRLIMKMIIVKIWKIEFKENLFSRYLSFFSFSLWHWQWKW